MHISELSALTAWIDRHIVGEQIQNKYQALQSKIQLSTNKNQQQQPFGSERERAGLGNSGSWIKDDSSAFWANNVGQERRNHESQTTQKPLA